MDHKFSPSTLDAMKCSFNQCGRPLIDHTDFATCESCPNVGKMELYADMLLCPNCIRLENEANLAHQAPELQEKRLQLNDILIHSRSIDTVVQLRTDIHNAETVAIDTLRQAIELDESVTNKRYRLAEVIKERYLHHKTIIFELSEQLVTEQNKQRVQQQYLNQLASSLRQEERDKLNLEHPNYQPVPFKISKPRASKKTKIDRAEIKKWALDVGVPEAVIMMLCTQKNITPEEAANRFRKADKEVRSETE